MIHDIRVAATVAGGTVVSGITQVLDLIPDNIGKLATLIGIILSSVLIYIHIRRARLERAILEKKLKEG